MTAALAVDDLSVELGGLPVLRRISLGVRPGEAVALMGGNGSGKSTLVRSALGLLPVQHGSIELFGTPLRSFRSWSRVGYVPQRSPAPLAGAKVREVVGSGRLAHRRVFLPARATDRAAVGRALELVGLADRAREDMAHLSGGQHQRVLIARALAAEPDLLVLDEPNAGVDVEHQRVLAELLTTLLDQGTAVLVVLHEVGPLSPLITRAVVLREGRTAYDGALEGLSRPAGVHHHDHDHRDGLDQLGVSWLNGAAER
jgi:zinc transport system ATP-binding protein